MTVLGEAMIVALAFVAGIGGLVAVLYFLWLIAVDMRQNASDRASAPRVRVVHIVHHAKR